MEEAPAALSSSLLWGWEVFQALVEVEVGLLRSHPRPRAASHRLEACPPLGGVWEAGPGSPEEEEDWEPSSLRVYLCEGEEEKQVRASER